MKKQQLVKRGTEEVAVPDYVELGSSEGFESVTSGDLLLPRLNICQSMTPQRKKSEPSYIPGLEEGDFFNVVTGEIYPRPLRVTPLMMRNSRIKWNDPKEIGSGIECFGLSCPISHKNPEGVVCQLNEGGACLHPDFNDEDHCSLFKNYPLFLHEPLGTLIVLSFKSTGLSVSRNWISTMKLYKVNNKSVPMYLQQFDLDTKETKNPKGTFYQVSFTRVPGFPSQEVAMFAKSAYASLAERTFGVSQDEGRQAGTGGEEEM